MKDCAAVWREAHGATHAQVQSMKENEKLHGDEAAKRALS
jgi:hypothetical protein